MITLQEVRKRMVDQMKLYGYLPKNYSFIIVIEQPSECATAYLLAVHNYSGDIFNKVRLEKPYNMTDPHDVSSYLKLLRRVKKTQILHLSHNLNEIKNFTSGNSQLDGYFNDYNLKEVL